MSSDDDLDAPASSEFYLDQALEVLERALRLVDTEARPDLHGVVLHDMAEVYEATGRASEAVDLYRRSAEAKRRRCQPSDLLVTLLVLASRLIDRAEFEEARAVTEEAAELIAAPGDGMSPSHRAGRAFDLGVLYDRLGDAGEPGAHRKALDAFELALSLYDGVLEPQECAAALREIGRLQLVLGRGEAAVASLTEAVRYFEQDGDRDGQVVVLIDLCRLYQRLAERSASRTVVPEPRVPEDDAPAEQTVQGDAAAAATSGPVERTDDVDEAAVLAPPGLARSGEAAS